MRVAVMISVAFTLWMVYQTYGPVLVACIVVLFIKEFDHAA